MASLTHVGGNVSHHIALLVLKLAGESDDGIEGLCWGAKLLLVKRML